MVILTRKDKLGMGTASGNLDIMPLSEMERKKNLSFRNKMPKKTTISGLMPNSLFTNRKLWLPGVNFEGFAATKLFSLYEA